MSLWIQWKKKYLCQESKEGANEDAVQQCFVIRMAKYCKENRGIIYVKCWSIANIKELK